MDKNAKVMHCEESTLVCVKPCFVSAIIASNFKGVDDLLVTGVTSPDCTGVYVYQGIWNGQPFYYRTDGAYGIGCDIVSHWEISRYVDDFNPPAWRRYPEAGIYGEYKQLAGSAGVPTVALLEHGEVSIYDGYNSNGVRKLFLAGENRARYEIHYIAPIYFAKGLYVSLSAVGINCLLTYQLAD